MYDKNLRGLAVRIGLAMLIFYGMFSTVATIPIYLETYLLYDILEPDAAHIIGQGLYGIFYFLSFSIPALILCKMQKKKIDYRPITFREKLPKYTPLIIVGAISINFAVAYFNSLIFMPFISTYNDVVTSSLSGDSSVSVAVRIIMMFFTTAIVPALCEEFLFRGAMISNLSPYGRGMAIFFSSLMFGLMHQNLFQLVYTMLLGVVLGCVYVKTKSLWCCVLIHFFNNGVSVLQEALFMTLEERYATIAVMIIEIAIIAFGAFSVVFLLAKKYLRPRPIDVGSFGVIHEPDSDYAEYTVTKGKKVKLLLSPTVIAFSVIAIISIASMLLTVLLMGAIA